VAVLLPAITLAACAVPAPRAARVDPIAMLGAAAAGLASIGLFARLPAGKVSGRDPLTALRT
jgi:hypothetical protein